MPLSLEQYADFLDGRDLPWPVAPEPDPPKAKPHLVELPKVRAVMWNLYGTLLSISTGELLFEHPNDFVMRTALDKTIQEFKMWQSMSRKPGQPSEYMKELYDKALFEQKAVTGEPKSEKVWESLVLKLFQKDYAFDAGFYGSLNEYSEKIAFFFHESLQGTACYPGAAETLTGLREAGMKQGLLADGQCFSGTQLRRALKRQSPGADPDAAVREDLRLLSTKVGARKPAEKLFEAALTALERYDIGPRETLHVGTSLERDVIPAKGFGMRTALFAGDRQSLRADPARLKDPGGRPDLMITELPQLLRVLG
jgi:FMN phosphatase YigB (HAD superfamily)